MRWKRTLPAALLAALALLLILGGRPGWHLWRTYRLDAAAPPEAPAPARVANDVSRLNPTAVRAQIAVAADPAAAVRQLRGLLRLARTRHLPVAVAGARHSMGGHTLAPDGLRLDMLPFHHLRYDSLTQELTAGSGARWADVIPYLNRYGRAVATMQSDNAFSVGGSLSVNCHGWQPNAPPVAATVVALRLLVADGQVLTCSRTQHPELFRLALGGYGLFGVILDARLRTVPNEVYACRRAAVPAANYLAAYARRVDANPRVHLAYGRLNVTADHFLEEATLNYYETQRPAGPGYPLPADGASLAAFKRAVFLGSKRGAYGKRLRWNLENRFGAAQAGRLVSRNQVMNESPALYLNRAPGQTDVLHEYFVPRRGFERFRRALQRLVPAHPGVDLLNVTLRNVYPDRDTFLPYAREEVFGFVLFFNQPRTPAAEADMQALTCALTDAATEAEGTYYLPYRLHATPAQLRRAYPAFPEFLRLKRRYDPDEVFQNLFYQRYRDALAGADLAGVATATGPTPAWP